MRSGGPGPTIARTRGGLLGQWATAMVCCGGMRVDTNNGLDYTMAYAVRSFGHRADMTSHTTSLSPIHPDCPYRSMVIEAIKYYGLKLQYLLNH